ncbi:MAG: NAD(P)(+) transhydrogenase (Re/Si-specific) subunit alpha, partial [Lentisphaerae bacterium]
MKVVVPAEREPETRVPMLPQDVRTLKNLGAELSVEKGLGKSLNISDEEYGKSEARVVEDITEELKNADLVLRMHPPRPEDVSLLKPGAIHVSYMDPFNNRELVDAFARHKISAISLEMIPRITVAQKMDVLSSQANLAGYVAVLLATTRLK